MIKIRLHGELEEIKETLQVLTGLGQFRILQISEPYKDRGNSVYYRAYVDAEVKEK